MDTFPRSFLSHVRTAPPGHYGSYLGCWSSYTIFLRVIGLPRLAHHSCVVDYCTFCTTLVIVSFAACHSFNYSMGVCVFDSSSSVPPWTHEKLRSKSSRNSPQNGILTPSASFTFCTSALGVFVDSCALTSSANEGVIFANSCMACLPSMLVTFHDEIYSMAMYQTSKMFK